MKKLDKIDNQIAKIKSLLLTVEKDLKKPTLENWEIEIYTEIKDKYNSLIDRLN